MNIFSRIKNAFATVKSHVTGWGNQHRAAQEPRRFRPVLGKHRPFFVQGRRARCVEWCAAFMARNGRIVPEKSPESIYLAAMRPKRRRHA